MIGPAAAWRCLLLLLLLLHLLQLVQPRRQRRNGQKGLTACLPKKKQLQTRERRFNSIKYKRRPRRATGKVGQGKGRRSGLHKNKNKRFCNRRRSRQLNQNKKRRRFKKKRRAQSKKRKGKCLRKYLKDKKR